MEFFMKIFMFLIMCMIAASAIAAQQAGKHEIQITCSKPDHRFKCGEKVEFTINSNRKQQLLVRITKDGGKVLLSKKITPPAKVSATLEQPGFLRCMARVKKVVTYCGAGVEPENIRPVHPKPADFDKFWDEAIAEFHKLPLDLNTVKCPPFRNLDIYRLDCANVNGKRAYAMLAIPKKHNGKVPLLTIFGGGEAYTSETGLQGSAVYYNRILKRPCAVMIFHLPPYPPVKAAKKAKAFHNEFLKKIGYRRYIIPGLENPKTAYGYSALAGCLRLLHAVAERPEIDKNNIIYTGSSHGGTFGIYLSACSGLIKAAFCGVPSFCDFAGFTSGRKSLELREAKEHWKSMQYFDCAYFADRIKNPVYCSAGFIDLSCPPSGVYAMYNQLKCPKKMYDKVNHGHSGGPADYSKSQLDWLKAQLDRK